MSSNEIKAKIEIINNAIENHKKYIEDDKKTNKNIILLIIMFSIILVISNTVIDKSISFLDVVSISLFVASSYDFMQSMVIRNLDNKSKLEELELGLKYYKNILNNKNNINQE